MLDSGQRKPEVFTAAAMLGGAGSARAALAIMADAAEVATTIVG